MKCDRCGKLFNDYKKYSFHLKFYHNISDYFSCPYINCSRVYNKKRSLVSHLKSCHKIENNVNTLRKDGNNLITPSVGTSLDNSESLPYLTSTCNKEDIPESTNKKEISDVLKESIDSFVSKLYDKLNMTRSNIQDVILAVKKLTVDLISFIKQSLENETDFENVTRIIVNSFSHIDTEYKRIKYFETCNKYVNPVLLVVGSAQEKAKKNDDTIMILKESHVCMVSIRQNLQLFLELPGVYDRICSYQAELRQEPGVIRNVVQGENWKKTHEDDNNCIPLIIFFDDLETGNPLGSHAGKNKIGAVYVSIATIPPEYSSRLENIFLAMLFYSDHRRSFGNKKVFDPIIKELNFLTDNGVSINVDGVSITVKFSVAAIAGDNLGIHGLMGFYESFSAINYCRFCLCTKHQCQSQLSEDTTMKRNINNYTDDVDNCRGIKEVCVWNDVKNFHVYSNLYCDVMHDICEGAHRYGMALIVDNLIRQKFFTLQQLNDRIKFFDFKSSNPPPEVSKNHLLQGSIIFSASEMLCFVRHFQFLVGDLVPSGIEVWSYYLTLLELTNVAMSQSFNLDLIQYLQCLISEHHEKYIRLFGALKPKHHFLVHYPEVIRKIGPLILISTFKYESKHLDLKRVSNSINTQRNVPLSLAIKCQLQCCYRCLSNRGLPDDIEHGKVKRQLVIQEPEADLAHINVKWVTINGIKYTIGDFLVHDYDEYCEPHFCKIDQILIKKDCVTDFYFQTLKYKTVDYNEHFQSFIVEEMNTCNLLRLTDCYSVTPMHMYAIGTRKYVNY